MNLLNAMNGGFRYAAIQVAPHPSKLAAHIDGPLGEFMLRITGRQNNVQHLFTIELHAAEVLADPGKPLQLDRSSN